MYCTPIELYASASREAINAILEERMQLLCLSGNAMLVSQLG